MYYGGQLNNGPIRREETMLGKVLLVSLFLIGTFAVGAGPLIRMLFQKPPQ
jgi:hypothetical protein